MKRVIAIISIALMAFGLSPSTTQGQLDSFEATIRRNPNAIPEHYIVRLKDEVTSEEVEQTASRLVSSRYGSITHFFQFAIKGFSVVMSEADATALSKNRLVAYVEEDAIIAGDSAGQKLQSNSAAFSTQSLQSNPPWGLDRIDQRDLPLDNSYSYTNTGAGVNVYVIGTGIRFTHQEFGGRAVLGIDTVGDGQDGNDCNGLGTAVAATIGGATFGVAKSATLYAVRAFNCSNGTTVANLIAAIDWVTGNHISPAVAHMSISTAANATIDAAVSNSIASGVSYTVAAGDINVDAGTRSPARVAAAMTVGGTNTIDTRVTTSNFGAVLDVFAPGQDIPTASHFHDTATTTRTGTALAAAHVAGEAARYLQANATATPGEVSQAITSNATLNKVFNPGLGSPNLLLNRPGGKIAFHTNRTGNFEIYAMNYDGSNQTNLSNNPAWDAGPVWSPDGSKIAFTTNRNGNIEIYVMNSAGGNQVNLTQNAGGDLSPAWSPDGTKIAFSSDRSGSSQIYVMNADGSNQIRLTASTAYSYDPAWSPDGTKIIYRGHPAGDDEIYVMDANGANQTRLTFKTGEDHGPKWSPDGSKIAFESYSLPLDGTELEECFVMNSNGSGLTKLTANANYEDSPSWSPDSTRIAFASQQATGYEIYTIFANNSNLVRVTNNSAYDGVPIWSLDGAQLLFITTRPAGHDIYIMNVDGSNQTGLTSNTGNNFGHSFQPF